MKILITGGCGFVGSNLAIFLKKNIKNSKIISVDNLFRPGSRINKKRIEKHGIKNFNFDISNYKKIQKLPSVDLIVDCCAEAAIEVSKKEPDRVIFTNFVGTYNILKKCIKNKSNIIFLSSSRVYSINKIRDLIKNKNLKKKINKNYGIKETFDTSGVKSIYGLSKIASEDLIKEINYSNNVNYIINRFGVISGPWQFGKQDQGFMSLWMGKHINKKSLSYIGFGGFGNQVRDVLHIDDVCEIIFKQIVNFSKIKNITFNIGGGKKNSVSLKELTNLCQRISSNKIRIKKIKKTSDYDIPYFITDNSKIYNYYKWKPTRSINSILWDIYFWLSANNDLLKRFFK